MTALIFSSSASRRNSVTTLSAGPASSVKTGTTLTPPIPPSRLIFSIHNSAALRAGMPNGPEAGPDRNATTPILSSLGAPAGGAARAPADRTQTPLSAISAEILEYRVIFVSSSQSDRAHCAGPGQSIGSAWQRQGRCRLLLLQPERGSHLHALLLDSLTA